MPAKKVVEKPTEQVSSTNETAEAKTTDQIVQKPSVDNNDQEPKVDCKVEKSKDKGPEPERPKVGRFDREFFHRMLNLDEAQDPIKWYNAAIEYVETYMDWTKKYGEWLDDCHSLKPFDYSPEVFRKRMEEIYEDAAKEANKDLKDIPKDFIPVKDVRDRIMASTPSNMTDGAWVRGLNMRTGFVSDDIMKLFRVLMDELGDGIYDWNHSNVYRSLCTSAGFHPPHPKDSEFINSNLFTNESFVDANFQLAISLFNKRFYPEIIGFTLSIEWNQVSLMVPNAMYRQVRVDVNDPESKLDHVYYSMHLAVDNAATGHGRLAYETVVTYLESLPNEDIRKQHWKRIWQAYIFLQTAPYNSSDIPDGKEFWINNPTTQKQPDYEPDEYLKLTPEKAMIKLIKEKAPEMAIYLDGKTLDGKPFSEYLNQIAKDGTGVKKFLNTLSESDWINKQDPQASKIFDLMELHNQDGVLYGVFNFQQQAVWARWIWSLDHSQPDPPPGPPPDMNIAEQMKETIDYLLPQVTSCGYHSSIDVNIPGKDTSNMAAVLTSGSNETMKALRADTVLRHDFQNHIQPKSGAMNGQWLAKIPAANNQQAYKIANNWISNGCPLVTDPGFVRGNGFLLTENATETLFGNPTNAPTFVEDDSKLFYSMMNIEDHVTDMIWLNKAKQLVKRWTKWAEGFAPGSTSSLDHPFDYSPYNLLERMKIHFKLLHEGAKDKVETLRLSAPNLAETTYMLKQSAPLNLLEGAWLRGTPLAVGPVEKDQADLFYILQELYGEGDIGHNRFELYKTTLADVGIVAKDPTVQNFTGEYLPEASSAPLFHLCVSQFSTLFYPDLLGITLWMTWSSIEFLYEEALLNLHHLDPTYFRAKIAVSNASDTGHAKYALNAVNEYMKRITRSKGKAVAKNHWTRIWNAFIVSKYQRYILQTTVTKEIKATLEESLEDQMIDMVQRKAPYARFNHQGARLDGKLMNDWFEESLHSRDNTRAFLNTLVKNRIVNVTDPLESPIFHMMHFDSVMFGVFRDDEKLLWLNWIESLTNPTKESTTLPTYGTPTTAIEGARDAATTENFKKALKHFSPKGKEWESSVYLSKSLQQLLDNDPDGIVSVLQRSRTLRRKFLKEITSRSVLGIAWTQKLPGLQIRGTTLAIYWCENLNRTTPRFSRLGHWVPGDDDLEKYVIQLKSQIPKNIKRQPAMTAFREEVSKDAVLYMYLHLMVEQAKQIPPCGACADTVPQLLDLMEYIMTVAPGYNDADCPMSAIFDTSMATRHGHALFRYPPFNKHLKRILNVWGAFLKTEKSSYTLNSGPNGWYSPAALIEWKRKEFVAPTGSYKTWNDFFTRKFKEGMRPINQNETTVVSACEASLYRTRDNIKMTNEFWIKDEPYSLQYILGEELNEFAPLFVGGSIYQGFLHSTGYHHFHAPLAGRIIQKSKIDGLYYSDAEVQGIDFTGPGRSQGYLAHCAARGIILIEAAAPVGIYAIVVIGMTEISGIEWREGLINGTKVKRGEDLGNFSFGGSSHCLIFQKGAIKSWVSDDPNYDDSNIVKLGEAIGELNKA